MLTREPLRLAFLGCGFITQVHSRHLKGFRSHITCSYASRDRAKAEEYCRRFQGTASFADYGAAIDDPRIDAVVVAVPPRFHVELTLRALAAGKHVLVASAQYAPYHLRDKMWDATLREGFADRVTDAIEAAAPCFRSRVLKRVTLTPREIETQYGLSEGAVTHGELMLDQILFMRPVAGWGRYATPIDGLYIGGAGTHPGPGVLGGAGWLAAARLLRDLKAK